jgi:hypothetical protein
VSVQLGRKGKQQRTRADHDDALAWYYPLSSEERVGTASRKDTRKRPTGEDHWTIVRAGCDDHLIGG